MTDRRLALVAASMFSNACFAQDQSSLRPPAIPLVTHNPYFSAWCRADKLTDQWPTHWTGGVNGMCGMVRWEDKTYRWLGPSPTLTSQVEIPAMELARLNVRATSTIADQQCLSCTLSVRFTSPVQADDPDLASRPMTFIDVFGVGDKPADVYLDVSGEWCVHDPSQSVIWTRARLGLLGNGDLGWHRIETDLLRMSSVEQPVLRRAGDYTRIDWGAVGLIALGANPLQACIASHSKSRAVFKDTGLLPGSDDLRMPRSANDDWPVLAVAAPRLMTGDGAFEDRQAHIVLAYDDQHCVEYFGRKLRPYWARSGMEFGGMLKDTIGRRREIVDRCDKLDKQIATTLRAAGGDKYARVCELIYRQVMAAHIIAADFDGTMLMFSKENTSNGCIGTVDVIFPACPFFLALNPSMLEAQLRPVLDYAASPRWKFDFAPHDLGTYPLANGQVYGGGERTEENQMPVEECGNMLIMLGALAKQAREAAPEAQSKFISEEVPKKWWPTVTKWAEYLKKHGLDPENQLCTDDFAGHLARNANLAVKAIIALGAYSQICMQYGDEARAAEYRAIAEDYAKKWLDLARDPSDDSHTVLAYGKPGTWSLKYNMIWDEVLGLGLFPRELKEKEVAFYKTKLNKYGVPMDNRAAYTKPEWLVWAACMASTREDFEALVNPIFDFANETPDRVPFSDWYMTDTGRTKGMYARSVVGGMYMPLLLKGKWGSDGAAK